MADREIASYNCARPREPGSFVSKPTYWQINKDRLRAARNAAARRYRARHRDAIKVAEQLMVPIAKARSLLARTQCR